MLKVQNTFPIKEDLIQCSIILYKKGNLSHSRDKKRNRSLLDNKPDFPYKKKKNKKNIKIRININNSNHNKIYYKIRNKPLTCSTSRKNNVMKILKKEKNNSEGKNKEIKFCKNPNNSMHYKCYNSINIETINNINNNNLNKSSSVNKKEKNKKNLIKKEQYGEFTIENHNTNKNTKMQLNLECIKKIKERSTKNKNKIIIYNNIFPNMKKRNNKYYSKIEKYKIDFSKTKTMDKLNKINSHSHNKYNNNENSKINNDISNLSKRKSYIVPSIRAKKKKIEIKKEKSKKYIDEEEHKQLFMSHLIESKQIEYLKDFEKYKIDFKDRLIKSNEKKIKALNDINLIDRLMTSEEESEGENDEIKKVRYKRKNLYNSKGKKYLIKNNNSKNKEINKQLNGAGVEPEEYKNSLDDNLNEDNIYHNFDHNQTIMYNSRKPKINTLEYIYRINNNIDMNKLITSISSLDINNNILNINNLNECNTKENIEPESLSSLKVFCERKTIRPKEEINDFMKNNKIKIKRKEIKLKKEKNKKLLKKFKNFVELQKKIEENKKNKLLTKSIIIRNSLLNKNQLEMKEDFILNALDQIQKTQNASSISSSLNQQELYLSIYEAQKIYENNPMLIKNNSMILDNPTSRKSVELNNKDSFKYRNTDYTNYTKKKLDQNMIKTIKNVIFKLNNFIKDCSNINPNKKNNNLFKNKKSLFRDYDYILKNANRFLKEKQNQNIISKKSKIKKPELLIPHGKNFKKISVNEIKKIIKNSHNNIHVNNYKVDIMKNNNNKNIIPSNKNKKFKKILNKNHSAVINKIRKKRYIFTNEQLYKYKEIFNYVFIYLKLFIQKNIFNRIISYVNIKYKYISAFNQIIFFIKKKPFNYLRIIQQREYYQVILKQFYLPYLNRALNKIKSFAVCKQIFFHADLIIKQIYYMMFFKRMFFYINIKEDYKNDILYNSKKTKKNNKIEERNKLNKKHIEPQKELINNSSNKDNSESYDEIKIIKNTFSTIIDNISLPVKIFVFNFFKKCYIFSKNKEININNKQLIENIEDNKINSNAQEQKKNKNINLNKFNNNENIQTNKINNKEISNNGNNNINIQIEKNKILNKKKENTDYLNKENNLLTTEKENNNIIGKDNREEKNSQNKREKNKYEKYKKYYVKDNKNNIENKRKIKRQNVINNKIKKFDKDNNDNSEKKNLENINTNCSREVENIKDNNSLNLNISNNINTENNNLRQKQNNNLPDNNDSEENNKKLNDIPNKIKQKLTDDLTNEIISELFKDEIENKLNLLSYKQNIKRKSNSNINELANKKNIFNISHSPGKSNSPQNLFQKNNESNSNGKNNNNQEEDTLNTSIFMRTVYEIKKEEELNFYDNNVFPKLLNIIEKNVNKNYLNIINNLKEPLKKNDNEVMEDLSNLITYDNIINNNIIKYQSKFYNKNIIKKEFIDKKILTDFNNKIKDKSLFFDKYYYHYLNKCIYDTINEIIENERLYGNIGQPLLWSIRSRKLEYLYQNTDLFKNIFISKVITELKKIYFSKIGSIIENCENINISQFSKERDVKFNENIRIDLKKENDIDKLDEQETIVKITLSKIIMNQLLNEVIEILEHIQNSRFYPERYNYKSIFSCDNIPLLNFQNDNIDVEEEEEEISEDRTNQ